jgi:hypothetical protein
MTTVIKIGDRVTWQNKVPPGTPITPLKITGCMVERLFDVDGKAAAEILCGRLGKANAWVDDLTLEPKPDKTTILSGG